VVERIKQFFLDWVASALAGKDARPVQVLERFAWVMGPDRSRTYAICCRLSRKSGRTSSA